MTLLQFMQMGLKGPLGNWVKLVFVLLTLEVPILFWTGYRFFTAPDVDARVFWGVVFLLMALMVAMLKIWYWIHISYLMTQNTKSENLTR